MTNAERELLETIRGDYEHLSRLAGQVNSGDMHEAMAGYHLAEMLRLMQQRVERIDVHLLLHHHAEAA